jgi:hypothetical protein
VLGNFLEISIHCPEVRESMEFYRRLGLGLAVTNDIWRHQYAAVTDGKVALGLHAYDFPSPSLTWVHPGLASYLPRLVDAGIEFEFLKTGEEEFHEVGFRDPDGQMITVLEARTFSPPESPPDSPVIGYFQEYRFPVRATKDSAAFWEPLGFVAIAGDDDGPLVLTSDGIDLCVHEGRPAAPLLVYASLDLGATTAELVSRGVVGRPSEDPVTGGDAVELTAPEGSRILIVQESI